MSWRNAGLNAHRTWRFQENYRNTKQISRLALALAAMPHFPDFLPTDEQAEVLIPDLIGCGDINEVVVQDEKQAARETSRLDLAGLIVPRFVIVPEFFDPYALSGSLRSGRLPVEREYHRGGAHA